MHQPEPEIIDIVQDEHDEQEIIHRVRKFQCERTYGSLELKFCSGTLVEIVERHQLRP